MWNAKKIKKKETILDKIWKISINMRRCFYLFKYNRENSKSQCLYFQNISKMDLSMDSLNYLYQYNIEQHMSFQGFMSKMRNSMIECKCLIARHWFGLQAFKTNAKKVGSCNSNHCIKLDMVTLTIIYIQIPKLYYLMVGLCYGEYNIFIYIGTIRNS